MAGIFENIFTHDDTDSGIKAVGYDSFDDEQLKKINTNLINEYDKNIELQKNQVFKTYSEQEVQNIKNKGESTLLEQARKHKISELTPYYGTTATALKDFKIHNNLNKMRNGQFLSPEEIEETRAYVQNMQEEMIRGKTIGGDFIDGLYSSVPFLFEAGIGFATTPEGVGLASLGQTGSKFALRQGAKGYAKTEIRKALQKTARETFKKELAEASVKSLYNVPKFTVTKTPFQVARRFGELLLDDDTTLTEEGQFVLNEAKSRPAIALMRALGDTCIENFSETSGALLGVGMNGLGTVIHRNMIKRLPKGFSKGFEDLTKKVTGLPFVKALEKFGYHGILEEMGEERVGDFLRYIATPLLQDNGKYTFEGLIDSLLGGHTPEGIARNLITEGLIFGVTGGGVALSLEGAKKGIDYSAYKSTAKEIQQKSLNEDGTYNLEKMKTLIKESNPKITDEKLNKIVSAVQNGISKTDNYSIDDFLLDSGVFRKYGRDSITDSRVRAVLDKSNLSEKDKETVMNFATTEDKIKLLNSVKNSSTGEELLNEEDIVKYVQQNEIEEQAYNKLLKGGVSEDVALANSKLFGQFFKKYGAKSKEAFDKWFNKLEVRYNVPANNKTETKQSFQSAEVAGAEEGEESEAIKEYQEKGTESKFFKKYASGTKILTSKEAENYDFKDKEGVTIEGFHGGAATFEIFNKEQTGLSNSNASHIGFWFTPSENFADDFANGYSYRNKDVKTYHCFIKMKNPKVYKKFDNSKELNEIKSQIEELQNKIDNANNFKYLSKSEFYQAVKKIQNTEVEFREKYKGILERAIKNEYVLNDKEVEELIKIADSLKEDNKKLKELKHQKRILSDNDPYLQMRDDMDKFTIYGNGLPDFRVGNNRELYGANNGREAAENYVKSLKEQGYDGIIIQGTRFDTDEEHPNNQFVVFDNTQIKSVNNQGTFDENNPNIYFQETDNNRNLLMTHSAKLNMIDNIIMSGSLVAPSMAITKKGENESLKNFGDVLFVRNPKKIDFQNDNIFDRDIYSPRMPAPSYELKNGRIVDSYEWDNLQRMPEERFKKSFGTTKDKYLAVAKKVLNLGYTPSGNLRIKAYNANTLLEYMQKEKLLGGENFDYGLSSLLAKLSKQQYSKEQLKETAKNELELSNENLRKQYEDIREKYNHFDEKLEKYYIGNGFVFSDQHDIFYAVAKNNKKKLSQYLDLKKLPKSLLKEIKDLIDDALKLPRNYFESKPIRKVDLSEFSYALAQKGTLSEEQKKELSLYGIKIIEYKDDKINSALQKIDKQEQIYFQEAGESEEKLIAGFTYPEVLEKLTELYEQLGNDENLSKDEQDKLMTKVHVLEDAFEVSEYPDKFSNEDQRHEIMLNAYYIMNNQEIPEAYVEADKISQRTYRDYVDLHNKKKEETEAKYYGYFSEGKDKNIITIMANNNSSTALHELGHLFLNGLNELARSDENASKQLEAVNKWLGYSGEYTVAQQEKFARSFEAYLYKGKAPNNYLREVFENFKEWLRSVYSHITELVDKGADISDEVMELFDNMFADDEYYQERKEANELLKRVKNISRKEKMSKVNVRDDSELDEVEKRHKNVAYDIVSVATGKSPKYLKTIFETDSGKKSFGKKRESIEMLLDSVDDKITVSGGMREEWKEFYSDTGVSYDNDEIDGDYKLFEQALDTIINKSYRNPEKEFESEAEARAEYYMKAIDEADRQYKVLIRSYEKENRNVALSAIYEWIEGLDKEIKQDYEDRFIYDSAMIDRKENVDKFDKAKRQILSKALEVDNRYDISKDEKYKEVVKEIMKNLNFLNPSDKAKLTTNILDVSSVDFLMSSIDNIMDIAKTMEDVNYRRKLEIDIHKELQQTKNVKKNGRTVGKYDYKTNKIFEELRELDKLTPEQANELRLEVGRFATAEDNGLSYKDKLINKFLSYKSGGRTFADTELMKELYDEITRIKFIGKSAKSELDLQEKLSEGKDIEELINIVQNKKDAKFLVKGYISGLGNLESTLNAIFNNDIKDRYGAEILYAETQAQAWQYKVKTEFEKEVAKIYNLPEWCWDKKILEYLGEKHTYSEIRRKYDTNGDLLKSRNIDRTLSKMDIIQAYIWSKNQVLEKRLINQFGDETLYAMFDELSLEDVKFAELMMRTAQSFYPMVNRAFIQKYGLDLPKVSCYFPSTPERGSEVDLYNDYSSKSLNNSFTKARAQSETQAMDFHNPVATLYNHIEGVAKFAFMSDSLDRANLRFKDLDLKRVIINKYGEDAYRTLEQILMNVTYKKEAPVFNGVNKIIDNMVGNWIQANVAIKPVVGLKQLLSANNYAVDMPYMTWQVGFLKALANPKGTIDYMMNIPYIKARYGGSFSNEFLKQTVENSAFALSKKLKDSMNMFIKMGDIGAIIFGGKPYVDYLIKEKGMSEEQAIKQFILSTNRSQQSSAVSSLSNFQVAMTRNPMGKLFIAFKNSPQQYVRMCGDAIVSCANGDMTKTQCAKYLFQFAYLQPFLYAAATSGSLFRLLFTGDDDDLMKDLQMSIFNLNSNAIPLLGDIYQYALNKLAYKEKYMPQTTPLLGDIEQEINKISKEDVSLADYLEATGYILLHVGMGYNSKAITSMGSGVGDIATGDVAKGSMKVLGYTDKRAKNITKNTEE